MNEGVVSQVARAGPPPARSRIWGSSGGMTTAQSDVVVARQRRRQEAARQEVIGTATRWVVTATKGRESSGR